jgi:hypothetical protein
MSVVNNELRRKLEEMTESGIEPSRHRARLAEISSEFPNIIQPLESNLPERRYTCGMSVFWFCEDEDYIEIARLGIPHVHAGPAFFEWLIAKCHLQEIEEAEAGEDDLVMYFDGGRWKHVGFWKPDNRVESKWGPGLLYDHGRREVPKNYGDAVRFFRSISPDEAVEHFVTYAKSHGVSFEETDG